jgi:radical SAM superfamily enzyme YgiQ (UPF0313 family)
MNSGRRTHLIKKVLLVSLDWFRPKDPPVSLGTASIATNLLKHNIDVKCLPFNVNIPNFSTDEVVQKIFDFKPTKDTLLGVGAYVWNEPFLQDILFKLKAFGFPGATILGGPQISYSTTHPQLYYPHADIFCRGYAEQAIQQLVFKCCDDNPAPNIPGIVYKGSPDMKMQASCDLESLPSPFTSGFISPQVFLRWETQRGCPFRCSFCQHRESDLETKANRKRRSFQVNRIMDEAHWISESGVVSDLAILDPTFNSGSNYLNVLDKLIETKYCGKISFQCRFEMVKEPFLDKIAKLADQGAQPVLEFGLQTAIKEESIAINRPNRLNKVESIINDLHQLSLSFEVSLIYGLPLQTLESFRESVNFCLQRKVPVVKAWPLMLLRGTPLDSTEVRKKYNLKEKIIDASEDIDRVQVNIPHVVGSSTFNESQWRDMSAIASLLAKTEGNHPSGV